MPKKRKVKRRKPRKVVRSKRLVAPAGAVPLTKQQQFVAVHNSALKNKARDDAQETRQAQAEEKELKLDTLKLQREVARRKLNLL
tara:strand:+ start:1569 stop:1823 length:255 start_codon:yes stop_codon:yes gene_type:complete